MPWLIGPRDRAAGVRERYTVAKLMKKVEAQEFWVHTFCEEETDLQKSMITNVREILIQCVCM